MTTAYTFKCMKCGKRFRTTRALALHDKHYHKKHEEAKKKIAQKKKEIHSLEKNIPKSRTNWLAVIILVALMILFIYFVYFRG